MNVKMLFGLVLALLLALGLAGCRQGDTPPAENPLQVTENFYNWYLDQTRAPETNEFHSPLASGAYRESPYLSAAFVENVDAVVASFSGGGYDPILMAQDVPEEIAVEPYFDRGDTACTIVHARWTGSPSHDLTVDLVKQDGAWKIDRVRQGNPTTPDGVTRLFYDWYLDYARNNGNPLVDGAYKDSEFLSATFVADVQAVLDSFTQGGFDPILLAQDIPVAIEVEEPDITGDMAVVTMHHYWGGNPDPSPLEVHLEREGDSWLIARVTRPEDQQTTAAPATPAATVDAFYAWYLDYIGDPATEEFRNPLVEKAYREAPYLAPAFVSQVDDLLASFEGGGYDPFLCAQDIPTSIAAETEFMNGEVGLVLVRTSFGGYAYAVELAPAGDGWQITDIACPWTADDAVLAFYTWYLGTIGRDDGEFRNLLVDGGYRDSGLLSEAFIARVDAMVAAPEGIGYDPFLLAQDIPTRFTVEAGPSETTAVVHEFFGADSSKALLVTVTGGGRWWVDDVAEYEAAAPAEPAANVEGWQQFTDTDYGLAFQFPADWLVRQLNVDGPGVPADWPVERAYQVMSEATAEQMAPPGGGPPDPNAPIVVAPLSIEILQGGEAAYERAYVATDAPEQVTIGGREVTVEREEPGVVRYVFRHPSDPELWVVIIDWVSEFSGREAAAAEAAAVIQALLPTVTFQ